MSIASKIEALKGLLRLATNNPNEAEAMAAIDRFHFLREKYGLNEEDFAGNQVELEDSYGRSDPLFSMSGTQPGWGMVDKFCVTTIAKFCGCKVWRETEKVSDILFITRTIFYGNAADVEYARHLRRTVKLAMEFDFEALKNTPGAFTRGTNAADAKVSFCRGMGERLNARMAEQMGEAVSGNGMALVVKRDAKLEEMFGKLGMRLGPAAPSRNHKHIEGAYEAGKIAGNALNFGRGVANAGRPIAIGKS